MHIKTLAEILAESDTDSASSATTKPKKTSKKHTQKNKPYSQTKSSAQNPHSDNKETQSQSKRALAGNSNDFKPQKKRKKRFHPAARFTAKPTDTIAYQDPDAQSIRDILAEVKRDVANQNPRSQTIDKECKSASHMTDDTHLESTTHLNPPEDQLIASELDNLPSALKAYLRTPEQKQNESDAIKAESRLRWLAFYYLSRREHGRAELKQKLIDKEQDPDKVDALLDEFRDKGYQSDYRTTLMLIRENIRKGRGRGRIKQAFYQKKIAMPSNIDELIDMANSESDEFREFVDDDDDSMVEGVDWLKLAVTARTKKYGNNIPTEHKDKARQVRFLQYRGFKSNICFAALEYTLETLDERF